MMDKDVLNVYHMVIASNLVDKKGKSKYNNKMVSFASSGSPVFLLGWDNQLENCLLNRKLVSRDEVTPMDVMYNTVHCKELIHPKKEGNQ
jgi:hypothetical protein